MRTRPLLPRARRDRSAVSVRGVIEERDALRETIARVRRTWPHLPVIVRITGWHESDIAHTARYAGSIDARAVLLPDEPIHPTLVRIQPRPIDLGQDVAEWVKASDWPLSMDLQGVVRLLVNGGPARCTVGQVLREALLPESHVRRRLRQAGLPPSMFWFSLGPSMCTQAECEVHGDGTCEQGIGGCTYTMVPWFTIDDPSPLLAAVHQGSRQLADLLPGRRSGSRLPFFQIEECGDDRVVTFIARTTPRAPLPRPVIRMSRGDGTSTLLLTAGNLIGVADPVAASP